MGLLRSGRDGRGRESKLIFLAGSSQRAEGRVDGAFSRDRRASERR